ncbi:glycosyltransferase family 2 protein [Cyclobacterium qasimii]|uniref:Lipooligosaccharide biosynthesis glycosyltransferase n=2 Tax=Cyclobacterium qasimii TaxID=1350429 RepID=S7WGA2_9BACT|nr:glycosyltransferase family 2 protein [Cyclobacterium qasimii]EPR65779.1 lipooligosaccharide biosynthesis glycosyltransferase [Cyclobacterium qasimii M12-11B]GEO19532.1 hypothetical protein CQA01_00660 [Cyclobacterium qasimii]
MISVIIPIFNNQYTIERAVLSILNDPIVSEILIVDDGSTDESINVSKRLAKNESLIKVFHHPNRANKGASASRNLGLANSKSNWIQFLDADDELLQGKLSGQFEMTRPDIAFILGNCFHVLPNGKKHIMSSDSKIWKGLIRSKLGRTSSILWNKKYLLKVNGWDEKLSSSQEYDLMFRLLLCKANIVFDKRHLTLIHKQENSISTNSKAKHHRIQNWLYLRLKIRNHLIVNRQFNLIYNYYFSGAVGFFCDENNISLPPYVNKVFYQLYKFELFFKIKFFNLFKFLKNKF